MITDTAALLKRLKEPANMWEDAPLHMYADSLENPDSPYARAVSGLQEHSSATRRQYRRLLADHPQDIPLRLGYAHWLSRSDDPSDRDRGEFIRLNLAADAMLAAIPSQPATPGVTNPRNHAILHNEQLRDYVTRENELLQRRFFEWAESDFGKDVVQAPQQGQVTHYLHGPHDNKELVRFHGNRAVIRDIERGEFATIHMTPHQYDRHAPQILGAPTPANVTLNVNSAQHMRDITHMPEFLNIRNLTLNISLPRGEEQQAAKTLAKAALNTQRLTLSGANDIFMSELATHPLRELNTLSVTGDITSATASATASAIGQAPQLGQLQSLDLRRVLGDHIAPVITKSNWQRLRQQPNFEDMQLSSHGELTRGEGRQNHR